MIVLSDVDGTLISPTVPESTACLSLFELLRVNGVNYVLATSRPWASLTEVLPRTVEYAQYCICADGAITLAPIPGAPVVISRNILSPDEDIVSRVLSAKPPGCSLCIFLDDRAEFLVAGEVDSAHVEYLTYILGSRRSIALSDVADYQGILSLGVLGSREQCESLMTYMKSDETISKRGTVRVYPEVRITKTGLYWCDVTSCLADKRLAAESLLNGGCLGTPEEVRPVIALGDGDNDVGMAELADLAYCPPWATSAMKAVAHEIECEGIQDFLGMVRMRIRSRLGV